MGWRDELRQGSFRGVPFYWKTAETTVGRRVARHDYPQRDDSEFEDLGKLPREFNLELFVLGAGYMTQRDRLVAAFEQPGAGALVHPTFGTLNVTVPDPVRMRESTEEGGLVRFTVTFVVTGATRTPTAAIDTAQIVRIQAASLQENELPAGFERSFSVKQQPGFVREASLNRLQDAASRLSKIAKQIPTNVSTPGVLRDITNLQGTVATLVQAPRTLAQNLVLQVMTAVNLASDPLARFGLTTELFDIDWQWGRSSSATPSRRQDAANQEATETLWRSAALAAGAIAISEVEFDSYQDAISARDRLLERLDSLQEATSDDDLYQGLSKLRAQVVADVAARGANLTRIVSYTPKATLPSLVLAHQLYGDATQAEAIERRNKIKHPGFVPGGVPLEVTDV